MGIASLQLNIPPKDFWHLSFCEFYTLFYAKFPTQESSKKQLFSDEDKEKLKEAEAKYLARQKSKA